MTAAEQLAVAAYLAAKPVTYCPPRYARAVGRFPCYVRVGRRPAYRPV